MLNKANAYMSQILGLKISDNSCGVYGCESERRTRPEEGYGMPWVVAILRRGNAWWISALPRLLPEILPLVNPGNEGVSGFSNELINGITGVLSAKGIKVKSHPHALCYLPGGKAVFEQPVENIRKITKSDDISKFGYGIPLDSIEFGSAFGAFQDNDIIGFAEATPLSSVIENFGIMLVGIEVVEQYRERGLGHSLLFTLTNHILNIGKLPWYHCSVTNIASQKTALSCGYAEYGQLLRFQT